MKEDPRASQIPADEKGSQPAEGSLPDLTPRRISGDDSLEASSPVDSRSDEKVIANDRSKTIAAPLQAVANTSEVHGNDDAISDDQD